MSFRDAPLICPICGNLLTQQERRLLCANAHSFDIARAGYVNLLGSYKNSHNLGDDKTMLHARRAFLQRGHYMAILNAVKHIVAHLVSVRKCSVPNRSVRDSIEFTTEFTERFLRDAAGNGEMTDETITDETMTDGAMTRPCWVADMGCGEGFYLHGVMQHLAGSIRGVGLDISKEAVRLAAGQNKAGAFAAANINRQVPLADQSVDLLLNIFAPRNAAEFARVLAPQGFLVVVIPTAAHLHEWRAALTAQGATPMPIAQAKQQRTEHQFSDYFAPYSTGQNGPTATHVHEVCYRIALDQTDLQNLLTMTPNAWHIAAEDQKRVHSLTQLSTTVSVQILTLQRGPRNS